MNFDQTPEFAKELNKFSKKWRNLPEDIAKLQKVVTTLYKGADGLPAKQIRQAFFATNKAAPLTILSAKCQVVKIRLDSQDLNSDKLRVVYSQSEDSVLLIELFSKNKKIRENHERIKKYTQNLKIDVADVQ